MRKRILTLIIIFFTAAVILGLGFASAVYYGYFHVNGYKAGKYAVRGVDVSHYQGDIDWQVLAKENIQFAYSALTAPGPPRQSILSELQSLFIIAWFPW